MPRYPLIIKHRTYILLYEFAGRNGKTLGKLINEILDREAARLMADGHVPQDTRCVVCGERAGFVIVGKGQQKLYVCHKHRGIQHQFNEYSIKEIVFHHRMPDGKEVPVER